MTIQINSNLYTVVLGREDFGADDLKKWIEENNLDIEIRNDLKTMGMVIVKAASKSLAAKLYECYAVKSVEPDR